MKNKLFLVGTIIAICFIMIFITNCRTTNQVTTNIPSMYLVSIPTADEEAEQLVNILRDYKWFMDNGYNISLPNAPLINTLKEKILAGETLSVSDEIEVKNLFKNEIYDEGDYRDAFAVISNVLEIADSQIPALYHYKNAWGFFIPASYHIRLTQYSPGGQYNPSNGDITVLTSRSLDSNFVLQNLLHETIHIGIENNIVQTFNVPHWTKERIVDQFSFMQFKSVLPNYQMQPNTDTSIDVIFQEVDVLDNLPERVKKFVMSE